MRPKLLVLDEPTEGIQPSIIKDIGKVIELLRARGDMAILLVEQYFEFARDLADRFAVMDRGEILDVTGRLDNRLTQAKTVELAVDGLDELFGAVGGHGIHTSQHVQRAWRDAHAIAHHISFNWDALSSMYGQHLLGVEPQGQF